MLLRTLQSEEWAWAVGSWSILLFALWVLFLLAAPVAFYYPTLTLLSIAGKTSRRAIAAMILLFPPLCFAITFAVTLTFFWIFGYIAIAIWSMTH